MASPLLRRSRASRRALVRSCVAWLACAAVGAAQVTTADRERARLGKLLDAGRAAVEAGDFADAVDTFEILEGTSDDPAFARSVARWLDRSRRSLELVDALPGLLAERPPKSTPSLRLRDGNRGTFVASDG